MNIFVRFGFVSFFPGAGCHQGEESSSPVLSAAFLPLSSFKTPPAALAPGSLICKATPRLPQPRRGGKGPAPGRGGRGEGGGHGDTPPRASPGLGAQAAGRLLLPGSAISHREELCWGFTGGYSWVNGAARWKITHLPTPVCEGSKEAGAPWKFPCILEIRFGEVSPGKGCWLLTLIPIF